MSKTVQRVDNWLSDKQFPLYVLAVLGILSVPNIAAMVLVVCAFVYSYLQRDASALRDPELWKRPVVQRFALLSMTYFWWVILTEVIHDCGSSLAYPGFVGLLLAPAITYSIALSYAHSKFPKASAKGVGRTEQNALQHWTNCSMAAFAMAFVYAVLAFVWFPGGVGGWLSNWLIASGRDAGLPMLGVMFSGFSFFVNCVFAGFLTFTLWPIAIRFSALMTKVITHVNGREPFHVAFLRVLNASRTVLSVKEAHPFFKNVCSSLWWLIACYSILFYVFGVMGGPLGGVISNWFDCSLRDTMAPSFHAATEHSSIRMFCGAIVALYGTVPLAISGAVFLPFFRRRQFELSKDGLFFPDGPHTKSDFRPLRLWSDLASVRLLHADLIDQGKAYAATLTLQFHTGGKLDLKLSQLKSEDLEKLLTHIDENATDCEVANEVTDLLARLRMQSKSIRKTTELDVVPSDNFKSTIFVTLEQGAWLPDGYTRVVRLLASRPLSCIYLVRTQSGQMAVAKQFFLPDDNDETRALRKCFEREHDLLKQLDHPALAKVIDVYHSDCSTFLILEHAEGTDLRSLIAENGPVSEETVLDWAEQLCKIMTYLHAREIPIVHRDLTPDNIILCKDGTLKIIDFGAAHQFLEGVTGTILGKQCYVSPEQLQGEAGPKSDIYSFGCVLHYLLTGKEPIALTRSDPSLTADVTSYLSAIVRSCTEYGADARPESFPVLHEQIVHAGKAPALDVADKLRKLMATAGLTEPSGELQDNQAEIANDKATTEDSDLPSEDLKSSSTASDGAHISLTENESVKVA